MEQQSELEFSLLFIRINLQSNVLPDVIRIIVGEPWVMDFILTTRKLIDGNVATDAIHINYRPAVILFKHKYIFKFQRVVTTLHGALYKRSILEEK